MVEASKLEEDFDYEALPATSSVAVHLLAGSLAGITEHTVVYPFDSIKVRMCVLVCTLDGLNVLYLRREPFSD